MLKRTALKSAAFAMVLFSIGGVALGGGFTIDQEQNSTAVYMAGFSQGGLAQSFQTQQGLATIGAGIFLQPGIGTTDLVRISLYDALPNQAGNLLAQAEAFGTAGEWVDVFWSSGVVLTPNTTYYLVFDGNITLGIAGDTANPYAFGQVFANEGYGSFPNFDYTFRTWIVPTPGALALLGLAGLAVRRRRRA